ncbi:MAG TPA: imidazole glycerol phosphate synthase subunit HisH [Chryseosolibacter sp.]
MSEKQVIILDYQLGNLFSVQQACSRVGLNARISSDKADIASADGIILPGVGAFAEAMANMKSLDLIEPLKDFVAKGKPLFGVCLGQQLLFTESEEFGSTKGLNFISGVIKKFPAYTVLTNQVKVPQIGWNHIYPKSREWAHTPLDRIGPNTYVYFVHSYYVVPEKDENILTLTNYEGIEYCSSVIKNQNIFATQFHPEKSGELGLSIYSSWGKQFQLI